MKIFKKLISKKGETYVEVLISILILALSALIIATSVTAANSINASARRADDNFYNAVSEAESLSGPDPKSGQIEIETSDSKYGSIDVYIYTDENGTFTTYAETNEEKGA